LRKAPIYLSIIALVLSAAMIVVNYYKYSETTKIIEEQEQKIEMLKQENATLVDDNFIMSQKLEKENAE